MNSEKVLFDTLDNNNKKHAISMATATAAILVVLVIISAKTESSGTGNVTATRRSLLTNVVQPGRRNLELAWLAGYPYSGTHYIRNIIHSTSQTSTATNYKNTVEGKIYTDPPYRLRTDIPFPEHFLLTETHCSGTCLKCGLEKEYVTLSIHDFYRDCAKGKLNEDNLYDPSVVKRVVHLIRNPFDNIVVRFVSQRRHHEERSGSKWEFAENRVGLQKWCTLHQKQDGITAALKRAAVGDELRDVLEGVPCFSLLFQYVQWHNNVIDMAKRHNHLVHTLHYDDLVSPQTGQLLPQELYKLGSFLELDVSEGPFPKLPRENYLRFFDGDDRRTVSNFVRVLAAQPVWTQIKRYLPDPTDESTYRSVGEKLSPRHYSAWPAEGLVWVLTYAGSGTKYFFNGISAASGGTTTATNYQWDLEEEFWEDAPNCAFGPSGPFRYHDGPFPPHLVAVKAHCRQCYNCLPGDNTIEVGFGIFLRMCSSGFSIDKSTGRKVRSEYDTSHVKKVVHIIRNPFDNIVVNFHFHYKNKLHRKDKAWKFSYNLKGFREWCAYRDSKYTPEDLVRLYGEEAAQIAKDVMCHGEIFQYVQWHNNALRVAKHLKIPQLIIHYEDFHNDKQETIAKLSNFLRLPMNHHFPDFYYDPYPDHFKEVEVITAKRFIALLSRQEVKDALSQYFHGGLY